jgi:ribosomal 50S subunit-associated protein YjgA (DUF615 family)
VIADLEQGTPIAYQHVSSPLAACIVRDNTRLWWSNQQAIDNEDSLVNQILKQASVAPTVIVEFERTTSEKAVTLETIETIRQRLIAEGVDVGNTVFLELLP